MSDQEPKFVFVGWNPFQLLHVKNIIASMQNACFVIEKRERFLEDFSADLLQDPKVPVVAFEQSQMVSLDGVFDVVVCQTPFTGLEHFSKSRIAMIQYGYAKEPHNYGSWRAFADLNLAYGPYAADKMAHFSPAVAIGNPRFDDWYQPDYHAAARSRYGAKLDPAKKTVLYAPTWGDLSSVEDFLNAIFGLAENFNVLIKMHHNTDLLEKARRNAVSSLGVQIFGASDDLLELISLSDVVISDYSGAIFDALFCRKPVVLLTTKNAVAFSRKLDKDSIEFARRDEIGLQVEDPALLQYAVMDAIRSADSLIAAAEPLRSALFNDSPGATGRAVAALFQLAEGRFSRTQLQSYVRSDIVDLYKIRHHLNMVSRKAS